MRRRAFVIGGIGAASGLVAWQFAEVRDFDTIEMVVRRRLDYLKLEPEGVRRFARDLAALHVISSARMHILSGIGPVYRHFPLSSGNNVLAYKLRHGEDRIVASYLISSDFFIYGADESRVVNYLGMLDPRRPCGNPFARSPT
jgi:hypothetical protein